MTSGRFEVPDMIMAFIRFQMRLPWIRRPRDPVVISLAIGERGSRLIIQIPRDCLMPGILPLSLQLIWPILRISLQLSSTVFRSIPASRDTAYVSSLAPMNLRPAASSTLENCLMSRSSPRRSTTRAGSSCPFGIRPPSTSVLLSSLWDGWPILTSSLRPV